jgi:hypothetical protein
MKLKFPCLTDTLRVKEKKRLIHSRGQETLSYTSTWYEMKEEPLKKTSIMKRDSC